MIAWVAPRTVIAVYDDTFVVGIDPVSLHALWRKSLPTIPSDDLVRSASGLVFIFPPLDGSVGPTTLTTLNQNGRMRSVVLTKVQTGAQEDASGSSNLTGSQGSLTVDPASNTAYVYAVGDPVAQVDLGSLTVGYHTLPKRTLASTQYGITGPEPLIVWLGSGLIAITGRSGSTATDSQGIQHPVETPAGLSILNTGTWTTRSVDQTSSAVIQTGGLLLAYSQLFGYSGRITFTGDGLSAYGLDGTSKYHLFGQDPISDVQAANGLAYIGGNVVNVITVASGKTVKARVPGLLKLLIDPPL